MTKCPKCNRVYAEDFAFCLDDGTPLKGSAANQATLVTSQNEVPPATLVMPSPDAQPPTLVMATPETQPPSPPRQTAPATDPATVPPRVPPAARSHATAPPVGPTRSKTAPPARPLTTPPVASVTHAPTPTTSGRPIVAIVIGVLALVLVVVVVGAVGLLLLNRGQTQTQTTSPNQNSNSASSAPAANPNPGATVIPLGELNNPNSSASPSTAGVSPSEGVISSGTYQSEMTRKMGDANNKVTVVLRIQIAVNVDGTYLSRGYMTIPTANIHDQLGIEERGNYTQSGDTLHLTNRKSREFNFDTGSWKGWTIPDDGSESTEKVRNVTPNTFQLFDDDEKQWFTFSKT